MASCGLLRSGYVADLSPTTCTGLVGLERAVACSDHSAFHAGTSGTEGNKARIESTSSRTGRGVDFPHEPTLAGAHISLRRAMTLVVPMARR